MFESIRIWFESPWVQDFLLPLIEFEWISTLETLEMLLFGTIFAIIIGFPVGILLCITSPNGITPRPTLYKVTSGIVNALRSFPFIILIILVFPLSRLILGTAIGTTATIIPLSIAAAPFVAKVIESALMEVDSGVTQAARAMGSTNWQIIYKVLVPEALPSIVSGITLTVINLIGYSAMAGSIGGGGLGNAAICYGYQRNELPELISSVVIIIILVEVIQFIGTKINLYIMSKR